MPPFYKRLHRKKDGRELFLYGLMPLEGPPLPEDAEPFRPAPHLARVLPAPLLATRHAALHEQLRR